MFITKKSGFTAIELLITLAVIVLLFSLVLPSFRQMREKQVQKSAVEDALSLLNKARSQTLASIDSSEYGVHFESNLMVLFKGTSYSSSDPDNQNVAITSPAIISDISLSGSVQEIYFERLTGNPSAYGTITISTDSFSNTITISSTGAFSTN